MMKNDKIEQPALNDQDIRTLYEAKPEAPKKNTLALLSLVVGVCAFLPYALLLFAPTAVIFLLLLSLVLAVVGIVLSVRSRKVSIHVFSTIGFICSVVVLCITLFIFLLALPILF